MESGRADSSEAAPSVSEGLDSVLRQMFAAPPVEPAAQGHLLPGTVIDGCYRIERRLGSGGMGVVYLAEDLDLDRPVAIKLRLGETAEPQLARLWREAKMMARLSHPNVVSVYEIGVYEGMLFIAMEYLERGTARQWLEESPRRWDEIVALYRQAGRGLAAAHGVGVVHRDFKPDNVLVGADGSVRVADFGLAQPLTSGPLPVPVDVPRESDADSVRLTQTGTMVGTPAYMAPEQRRGEAVDAQADQFAFCVALFEALYGQRPVDAASGELRERVEAIETVKARARVPTPIAKALRRGLRPDPAERHPDMPSLLAALEYDPSRRRRRAYLAIGTGTLAAAVGLVSYRAAERGPTCDDGARRILDTWNDTARARLSASFSASGAPSFQESLTRTIADLDAYAEAWGSARDEACRATHIQGVQSGELLDRRAQCLDRRRGALAAAVEVLGTADAGVVLNAHGVTRGLPSLSPCANATVLQAQVEPPPEPAAEQVAAIRAMLDRSSAQQTAGQLAAAAEVADEALARAEAQDYVPLVAEALLQVAAARLALGENERAVEPARRAHHLALEHRQDRVALEAALQVPFLALELSETLLWLDTADALAHRLGVHDDYAWQIALVRGTAYREAAQFDAALRELEVAIERSTDPLSAATARKRLADVHTKTGNRAAAREQLQEVLSVMRKTLGDQHWVVAGAMEDLALLVLDGGDVEEGRRLLDDAIAINRAATGPESPRTLSTLAAAGAYAAEAGDYRRAKELFEEALAIHERLDPPQPRALKELLVNAGQAWDQVGDREGAIALSERGLAISQQLHGDDHTSTATARINLAALYGRDGRNDEAEQQLVAAAESLRSLLGPHSGELLAVQFNLSQLYAAKGRLPEARTAAEEAVEIADALHAEPHFQQAMAAFGLGLILQREKRMREAAEQFERCAEITEQVRGPNHPRRTDCLYLQGRTLADSGQDPLASYEAAAAIVDAGSQADARRIATLFAVLADRVRRSDPKRARELAERARDAANELDPEHPDRVWVLEDTGRLLDR